MIPGGRRVELRRTLEQIMHCSREALSVVENGEDPRCALDDLGAAVSLIADVAVPALRQLAEMFPEPASQAEEGAKP
jgi:hypothetical protein